MATFGIMPSLRCLASGANPASWCRRWQFALQDSDIRVRWNALVALSKLGSSARPAVPEILKMLDDEGVIGSRRIKEEAQAALWRIAPERVGKPLVVEEATPMIANGVTTEASKLTY